MWSQERCQPWHRDAVTWAQVHHLARHDNALKYNSFRPAVPQFLPLILHHTLQLCRSRWPWLVLPKINLLLFFNRWPTCHSPTPRMEVNCILPTWEFLRTCTKRWFFLLFGLLNIFFSSLKHFRLASSLPLLLVPSLWLLYTSQNQSCRNKVDHSPMLHEPLPWANITTGGRSDITGFRMSQVFRPHFLPTCLTMAFSQPLAA